MMRWYVTEKVSQVIAFLLVIFVDFYRDRDIKSTKLPMFIRLLIYGERSG